MLGFVHVLAPADKHPPSHKRCCSAVQSAGRCEDPCRPAPVDPAPFGYLQKPRQHPQASTAIATSTSSARAAGTAANAATGWPQVNMVADVGQRPITPVGNSTKNGRDRGCEGISLVSSTAVSSLAHSDSATFFIMSCFMCVNHALWANIFLVWL